MKEKMYSETTRREYCPSDVIRIVNNKQALFYMSKNCELLDIYPSNDYKTGMPVLVYIFDKQTTQKLYKEWQANRPC